MKVTTATILTPILLVREAAAFAPPPCQSVASTTALRAEREQNGNSNFLAATAASALLAGAGVLTTAQPGFAIDGDFQRAQQTQQYQSSSSIYVAEIEQFALPSYDASKGTTLIDLNAEVENVNKKTLSKAKARREYVDTSEEKLEADRLRKEEKDGGSLLGSLVDSAEKQKKEMIAAEIAESRANRWKTF